MLERCGAACLLLILAGCAGAPPPPPAHEAAPPPAPAASSAASELTQPPFTVEQIRATIKEDFRYTWRIEKDGEPTVTEWFAFYRVNAEGARISSGGFRDDGTGFGVSPGHATWEQMRRIGAFPKAKTTITEETVEVPAGKFACVVYTVHKDDGSVGHHYFAKDLPGMPVLVFWVKDKKRFKTATLIEYSPGK